MDDLNLIAFAQLRLRPRGATHDLAIVFDGEPFGHERKLADEIGERKFLRQLVKFPVDLNAQIVSSSIAGG